MRTLFTAFRAITFGSGFVFLWGWVALALHRDYDAQLGFSLPAWTHALGILLMVGGGTLALACVAAFVVDGHGTPAPFDPPRKFVAVGPYRLVRNPMYLGGFATLFGFGLYEQAPVILLFALPWLLCAHLFVVSYEEPHLRSTFGPTYDAYCRSVRRWLPHFPKTPAHGLDRLPGSVAL